MRHSGMAKTKRRGKAPQTTQVSIRLDASVLDDAERLVPFLTARHGFTAARSDVLRAALMRGLRELTKEEGRESS